MTTPKEGYSEIVLDHFEHPRNNGVLEGANAVGYMTNPVCGDALVLMLRIEGERIEELWHPDEGESLVSRAEYRVLHELGCERIALFDGFDQGGVGGEGFGVFFDLRHE